MDDEPLAREGIREFLCDEPDVTVVGECRNGLEAVEHIQSVRPDLIFLDVQMPGLDGFGVVAALDQGRLPTIVFVTAYDEYALKAFEVHALDYLLKPIEEERFRATMARVRTHMDQKVGGALNDRLTALLEEMQTRDRYLDRLVVKSSGRVYFVKVQEIDWIEAAGNYARIHVGRDRHVIRKTMAALEGQLAPERFARIHRSTIVNLDRIKEFQPWFEGEHVVILEDGTRLSLSRKYRDRLERRLGHGL